MPMPKPNSGEPHDDFINRCMSNLSNEYDDEKQRFAVCESQWDKKYNQISSGPAGVIWCKTDQL